MWLNWMPWKYVIRRLARSHGFLDPIALLGRLHRFAQPSEVQEPIELLRAGVVFHARGLVNSRVIQHNLDWVWPLWVERQFDPTDAAFIPRAFSLTHINLTHRNWTAVGLPGFSCYPIVDPHGLLTPHYDGWSLDAWIIAQDGGRLFPSRLHRIEQRLIMDGGLAVETRAEKDGLRLESTIDVIAAAAHGNHPVCRLRLRAQSNAPAWLALAVRPYNPEGISFVHHIKINENLRGWLIDDGERVEFDTPAERHQFSIYHEGDVHAILPEASDASKIECPVGMATAAALFAITPGAERELEVRIPFDSKENGENSATCGVGGETWDAALLDACRLRVPDARFEYLYRAALHTLVLHAPGEVYPGPYTYKRFWYRDAAFILHALLCVGQVERVERALNRFPAGQTAFGYFHSQEGEWDANGEVLWIFERFCELTGRAPKPAWHGPILHGAHWIARKRLSEKPEGPYAGLLPAGFSAEHLGPIDFYYWDDFWGVAGLRAGARLLRQSGARADRAAADDLEREAENFSRAIDRSLAGVAQRLGRPGAPASPHRRLDAGAIGSLAAGYPLQLWRADDPRLLDTVHFLLEQCFVGGGFFQDMIHSGINPYLTLHVAQVLLRAGDARAFDLVQTVANLASPTGQWPEAVHPRTLGGCMGDGQHVWAAGEWVLALRSLFVREEQTDRKIILASGIPALWLERAEALEFGPTPTPWGPIAITIRCAPQAVTIEWNATWRGAAPIVEARLPGFAPAIAEQGEHCLTLRRA